MIEAAPKAVKDDVFMDDAKTISALLFLESFGSLSGLKCGANKKSVAEVRKSDLLLVKLNYFFPKT